MVAFWLGLFGCLTVVGTTVVIAIYKVTKLSIEKAEELVELVEPDEED